MDIEQTKAEIDIQERVAVLPNELTDLITDGTLDAVVFTLSSKHDLNPIQAKLLENEIALVLLLFLPPTGLDERIQESLTVPTLEAKEMAKYIDENILSLVDDVFHSIEIARMQQQVTEQSPAAEMSAAYSPATFVTETPGSAPDPVAVPTASVAPTTGSPQPVLEAPTAPSVPAEVPPTTPAQEPIVPVHTMQSDIDLIRAHQENTRVGYAAEETDQSTAPPRYQKPLTDTPTYTPEKE